MSDGERAQGHNSIIAAEDGRTYLVYHTRFQNGGEGHQVRVHQVFLNSEGWLCAAPFEYTGEETTDNDIATKELFSTDYIAGDYKFMLHRYGLDHANKALVTPVDVTLNADGTVSGGYTGTWKVTPGTCYIDIKANNMVYKGVLAIQTMEPKTQKALAFSGVSNTGSTMWGYKEVNEVPDGINEITNTAQTKPSGIYDMQGRKVNASSVHGLKPGLYIINGRKEIVR